MIHWFLSDKPATGAEGEGRALHGTASQAASERVQGPIRTDS
jgi:hypothetical protein